MTDADRIIEEDFTRLAGVARATRHGWASDGLIAKPASPYRLADLLEVVAARVLKDQFETGGAAVWLQLRDGFDIAATRRPCEAVVDVHTHAAHWVDSDARIAQAARTGHDIRLVDLTGELETAEQGFRIAAAPRRARLRDEVAERRSKRSERSASARSDREPS